MSLHKAMFSTAMGLGLILTSTGCATKKYVRNTVSPVDQRTAVLEKRTTEHGTSLESLDTGLAKTKEQLVDVEGRAKAAGESADRANTAASQANSAAQDARGAADTAKSAADNTKQFAEQGFVKMETTLEASNNYQMVANDKVLFPVNRWELTKEGKAALDELVKNVDGKKRFVVEVQGFADKSGPAVYNIELSQRRAEAVARYLTIEKQVPLRSVHIMGAGSEAPVADNKTRQGRTQNRRVEIRLFVPQTESGKTMATNAHEE